MCRFSPSVHLLVIATRTFGLGFLLLFAIARPASAALPPGYEDVMWCPAGYCRRRINNRRAGPARIFNECYNPTTDEVVDEVWTGDLTDVVAPEGWLADPEDCPADTDTDTAASGTSPTQLPTQLPAVEEPEAAEKPIATALTFDIPPYVMNASTDYTGGLEVAILTSALDKFDDDFDFLPMSYDDVETSIDRGVAEVALSVQVPTDNSYEKDGVYYSYPSWPFHNFVFAKKADGIAITSIQDLDDYGPVFTWEGAVDELGEEFYNVFSNSSKYRPIGNQTEQMDLFWSTAGALIVIDRAIFLTYSETQIKDVFLKIVEHNLFDPITTFGIGFKSKEMRDQFNAGLASMCERDEYLTLLVEYGVNYMAGGEGETNVICEIATAGASSSSSRSRSRRSFISGLGVFALIISSRF